MTSLGNRVIASWTLSPADWQAFLAWDRTTASEPGVLPNLIPHDLPSSPTGISFSATRHSLTIAGKHFYPTWPTLVRWHDGQPHVISVTRNRISSRTGPLAWRFPVPQDTRIGDRLLAAWAWEWRHIPRAANTRHPERLGWLAFLLMGAGLLAALLNGHLLAWVIGPLVALVGAALLYNQRKFNAGYFRIRQSPPLAHYRLSRADWQSFQRWEQARDPLLPFNLLDTSLFSENIDIQLTATGFTIDGLGYEFAPIFAGGITETLFHDGPPPILELRGIYKTFTFTGPCALCLPLPAGFPSVTLPPFTA